MAESFLQNTPSADRVHIAFFGKMNSGKSSLINALAQQQISIVSEVPGTTTDLVKKPMEIPGLGPCLLLDTPGFDDRGVLGSQRVELTKRAALQADMAVFVCDAGKDFSDCAKNDSVSDSFFKIEQWYKYLKNRQIPILVVINKIDVLSDTDKDIVEKQEEDIKLWFDKTPLLVSSATGEGIEELIQELVQQAPGRETERFITGNLLEKEDLVLLVMPQDIQAPKGRLILPQVQTLRELLDKKCLVMSVTLEQYPKALAVLQRPPKLIITDSQVFGAVYEKKPEESKLTSFSTLFAAYKGDIAYYIRGAKMLGQLQENDRVLIAECCTHAPLNEDIGRVKLPKLLRKHIGPGLAVDVVSGTDFPKDLSGYALVIQCGACMFNRNYVMARVDEAKRQQVPMTNYGVAIAYLNGILDKIELTITKGEQADV